MLDFSWLLLNKIQDHKKLKTGKNLWDSQALEISPFKFHGTREAAKPEAMMGNGW